MENKTLATTSQANIIVSDRWGNGDPRVEGVELQFASSTATARAMNIAMKMLALDWADNTLDVVEKMIDARLIEVATGNSYYVGIINHNDRPTRIQVRASSEEAARAYARLDDHVKAVMSVELVK